MYVVGICVLVFSMFHMYSLRPDIVVVVAFNEVHHSLSEPGRVRCLDAWTPLRT
jgi:hypothetical protein